ncbi:MAG TPA: hypothetical protein VFI27_01175 [candidate division Zixibacteria bacterium]|nr:hypothetical protein [candidate division Zixibacteria bacterium]
MLTSSYQRPHQASQNDLWTTSLDLESARVLFGYLPATIRHHREILVSGSWRANSSFSAAEHLRQTRNPMKRSVKASGNVQAAFIVDQQLTW